MRLSGVLSKPPAPDFRQVDRFLFNSKGGNIAGQSGQRIDLKDVTVTYEYSCSICEDVITFVSKGILSCVFISNTLISIDCVLSCDCGTSVPVWFLIESINDITGQNPEIRILDRKDKLTESVSIIERNEYTEFLDKAERAHRDGLGAGSMVYLRKVFESITVQVANAVKIDLANADGKRKFFKDLLKEVDKVANIIPDPFTQNKYKLYEELSNAIHSSSDEKTSLQKYSDCRRLVDGIIEHIKAKEKLVVDNKELKRAADSLFRNKGGGGSDD